MANVEIAELIYATVIKQIHVKDVISNNRQGKVHGSVAVIKVTAIRVIISMLIIKMPRKILPAENVKD